METPETRRDLARKYRALAEVGNEADRAWRLKLADALEWRAYLMEREQALGGAGPWAQSAESQRANRYH
ncbi:MAG TPA: hypothetical protein VMU87_23145 [Stellaceae bacterium]|nr:hypothetical protein [Stellaceae bacterium]